MCFGGVLKTVQSHTCVLCAHTHTHIHTHRKAYTLMCAHTHKDQLCFAFIAFILSTVYYLNTPDLFSVISSYAKFSSPKKKQMQSVSTLQAGLLVHEFAISRHAASLIVLTQ